MARILIIDDDPSILSTLRRAVERAGHEVSAADNGLAGLAQLASAPVDLVVTDIVMPEMEGIELIERLRRGYPGLPVIAMSGGGRVLPNTYLALARAMGASRILIKPFGRRVARGHRCVVEARIGGKNTKGRNTKRQVSSPFLVSSQMGLAVIGWCPRCCSLPSDSAPDCFNSGCNLTHLHGFFWLTGLGHA